jgi:hypothetical protein
MRRFGSLSDFFYNSEVDEVVSKECSTAARTATCRTDDDQSRLKTESHRPTNHAYLPVPRHQYISIFIDAETGT